MASGHADEDRHEPRQVDPLHAQKEVDFLTLPVAGDRNESWLRARGFIQGTRFSWTSLKDVYEYLHIARVDLRLLEACLAKTRRWSEAIVCVTCCHQALNCMDCEAIALARHIQKDLSANPLTSAITSAAAAQGLKVKPVRHRNAAAVTPGGHRMLITKGSRRKMFKGCLLGRLSVVLPPLLYA